MVGECKRGMAKLDRLIGESLRESMNAHRRALRRLAKACGEMNREIVSGLTRFSFDPSFTLPHPPDTRCKQIVKRRSRR